MSQFSFLAILVITTSLLFISVNAQPPTHLYLFHHGLFDRLYGIEATINSQGVLSWGPDVVAPNAFLSFNPTPYVADNAIEVWYEGRDNNGTLWFSVYLHVTPSGWTQIRYNATTFIQGKVGTGVALARFQNLQYIIYVQPAGELWYLSIDGSAVTRQIPTLLLAGSTPSAIVFNGLLHVFFQLKSTNILYHTTFDGSKWSNPLPSPSVGITQSPSAVVYEKLIFVFHQGPNGDGKLYYNKFDGIASWSDDIPIYIPKPINATSAPSAVLIPPYIYAFYSGIDNLVYYATVNPVSGYTGPYAQVTQIGSSYYQPGAIAI